MNKKQRVAREILARKERLQREQFRKWHEWAPRPAGPVLDRRVFRAG